MLINARGFHEPGSSDILNFLFRIKTAKPGELKDNWFNTEPAFFHHFDAAAKGLDLDEIPSDIVRYPSVNGTLHTSSRN